MIKNQHQNRVLNSRAADSASERAGKANAYEEQVQNQKANCFSPAFLSSLNAPVPHSDLTSIISPTPGTCQWLYDRREFLEWLRFPGSRLFYLVGNMGCGKTVLAKSVFENLGSRDSVFPFETLSKNVLYYFCNKRERPREDFASILRGLIYHFICENPQIYSMIFETCAALKFPRARASDQFHTTEELWDIFASAIKASGMSNFWILVDALDECEPDDVDVLMAHITRLLRELPCGITIKLFFTSRPHSHINLLPGQLPISFLEVQKTFMERDIRLLCFAGLEKPRLSLDLSSEEVEFLQKEISTRADGLFIWANLALMEVSSQVQVTYGGLTTLVRELPEGLSEFYDKEMQSVHKRVEDREVPLVKKILSWLLYGYRTISLSDLSLALAIDTTTPRIPSKWERYRNLPRLLFHYLSPFIELVDRVTGNIYCSYESLPVSRSLETSQVFIRIFHHSALQYIKKICSCPSL